MSSGRKFHSKVSWRRLKLILKRAFLTNDSPEKLARGFAIGVFWGVLPTFGFAILFSLPTSILFKANRLTAILGTFVSNPFTVPFYLLWATEIGSFILRAGKLTFSWDILKLNKLLNLSKSLLVGSVVLAAGMAIASYGILLLIIPLIRKINQISKHSS